MPVSMPLVFRTQLIFLLLGAFLGAVYQLFSALRHTLGAWEKTPLGEGKTLTFPLIGSFSLYPHGGKLRRIYSFLITFFFDILFFLFSGAVFAVLVYITGGVFRFSYLVFSAFGFFLFYKACGRYIALAFSYLLLFSRVGTAYAMHFLRIPLRFLFSLLRRSFLAIAGRIRRLAVAAHRARIDRRLFQKYKATRAAWNAEACSLLGERLAKISHQMI